MRFTSFFLSIFSLILSVTLSASAQASNDLSETPFLGGVTGFQKNDFKTAQTQFRAAAVADPSLVTVWYNLGVTEQRLGRNGLAMAFWRKALALRPGFQPAERAVSFTRAKLERADIPHDVELWETLRTNVLSVASIYQFAFLTLFILFVGAWTALIFIGKRRRAILDEKPLPPFPFISSVATVLFLAVLTLSICKLLDEQDLRATVIVKKVDAKALPDSTSTTLFELYEGLEVIVRQQRPSWVQVTYPGGATGWIARASIFATADRLTP